jgi:hypothetical protein
MTFTIVVSLMAMARVAIGVSPFLAAGWSSRLVGFPRAHDNPTARLMARMFGVRDAGLGILALYALGHPDTIAFLFLFNAAMDLGDLVSVAVPLAGRHGIDRAAAVSGALATIGACSWIVAWLAA